MEISLTKFDGPRLVRREETIDSMKLFRVCFGGPEVENEQEILDSYVSQNRGGVYAFFQESRPISQIMIFHDLI